MAEGVLGALGRAVAWRGRYSGEPYCRVEQADLTGKEVVLVTTGASRFEQSETDAFAP